MKKVLKVILILASIVIALGLSMFIWFTIINWDEFEQERLGYPDDPAISNLK